MFKYNKITGIDMIPTPISDILSMNNNKFALVSDAWDMIYFSAKLLAKMIAKAVDTATV